VFGNTILGWRVGHRFFVCDSAHLAVGFHLALDEFGCIVNTKDGDSLLAKILGHGLELNEQL